MEKIANHNNWKKPLTVFGYDGSWPIAGGDLFEAETLCTWERNMGKYVYIYIYKYLSISLIYIISLSLSL